MKRGSSAVDGDGASYGQSRVEMKREGASATGEEGRTLGRATPISTWQDDYPPPTPPCWISFSFLPEVDQSACARCDSRVHRGSLRSRPTQWMSGAGARTVVDRMFRRLAGESARGIGAASLYAESFPNSPRIPGCAPTLTGGPSVYVCK